MKKRIIRVMMVGYIGTDNMHYEWYDLNLALSRNPTYFFDIGARGIGKTTSFALWARKSWEKTGERWAIVTRRPDDLSMLRQNFWNDFTLGGNYEVTFNGIKSLIREKCPVDEDSRRWKKTHKWELFGVFLCLSDAISYKQASPFFSESNITKMLFDEFIIEDDSKRYLTTEPSPLFSIVSSVFRNRRRRVFCFSNAGFVNNPYFREYGITSGDFINSDFKTLKDGEVVFHYSRQPSPKEYEAGLTNKEISYQNNNLFRDVTGVCVRKRPPLCKPIYNVWAENRSFVLYINDVATKYYISEHSLINNLPIYTLDKFAIVKDAIYETGIIKDLKKLYHKNRLRFDTDDIRNIILNSML